MKNYQRYETTELQKLITKGDEVAFTELYNRYWNKLFAIAYNRLKEKESAQDIVHDVFAGVWANRHKPVETSLENYLAVAVKYAVLTRIKKKMREMSYKANINAVPVVEMNIETSLQYKQVLERVHEEIQHLPKKCKLIFKYSREAGMPVKQIAHKLELSPKTVENQLTKALHQIKLATRSLLHSMLFFLF